MHIYGPKIEILETISNIWEENGSSWSLKASQVYLLMLLGSIKKTCTWLNWNVIHSYTKNIPIYFSKIAVQMASGIMCRM